eukprot:3806664-Rhodomonas_salina.1
MKEQQQKAKTLGIALQVGGQRKGEGRQHGVVLRQRGWSQRIPTESHTLSLCGVCVFVSLCLGTFVSVCFCVSVFSCFRVSVSMLPGCVSPCVEMRLCVLVATLAIAALLLYVCV